MFLPGESRGQRGLVGYGLWGCKESDTTEQLTHAEKLATQRFRGKKLSKQGKKQDEGYSPHSSQDRSKQSFSILVFKNEVNINNNISSCVLLIKTSTVLENLI